MSDERFSKRLEPLLHATNAFICSVSGIINVQTGLLNPTPYKSFCHMDSYPYWCEETDNDCLMRGHNHSRLTRIQPFFDVIVYMLTIFGIIVLIKHVYKTEMRRKIVESKKSISETLLGINRKGDDLSCAYIQDKYDDAEQNHTAESRTVRLTELDETKILILQCVSYVLIYSIILLMPSVAQLTDIALRIKAFQILDVCLFPLQGSLHFLIFFSHKLWNFRVAGKDGDDLTFIKLVSTTLTTKEDPEYIVSGIEIIKIRRQLSAMEQSFVYLRQKPADRNIHVSRVIPGGQSIYFSEESGIDDASLDIFCGGRSSNEDLFPISIVEDVDRSGSKTASPKKLPESSHVSQKSSQNISQSF